MIVTAMIIVTPTTTVSNRKKKHYLDYQYNDVIDTIVSNNSCSPCQLGLVCMEQVCACQAAFAERLLRDKKQTRDECQTEQHHFESCWIC